MVTQYPHALIITWNPTPVLDENGEWASSGEISGNFESICRAEPNNDSRRKLTGVDGSTIDFAFTVFMPKSSIVIPYGADVALTIDGSTITGTVKRAFNGQLNSRIWL